MPRKKRDASRAMQRHPRLAEGTILGIQRIVLQDHSRCFIITTCPRANLQSEGKMKAMLQSNDQLDTTANAVEEFVALLARIAEPGHRYNIWQDVILACPLVLVARNLRQGHLLGIIAHQLRCIRRQRRARNMGPWISRWLHVDSVGVLAIVAIHNWAVRIVLSIRSNALEADFEAVSTGPMISASTLAHDLPSSEVTLVLLLLPCRISVVRRRRGSWSIEAGVAMNEIKVSEKGGLLFKRRRRHRLVLPSRNTWAVPRVIHGTTRVIRQESRVTQASSAMIHLVVIFEEAQALRSPHVARSLCPVHRRTSLEG